MRVSIAAAKRIFSICEKSLSHEDGGRLIGCRHDETVTIFDVLPSGPRAKKSSTSLYQDGYWQRKLYRAIEESHPEVDLLGSFHHHISAGHFPQLSSGDICTYRNFLAAPEFTGAFVASILVCEIPRDVVEFIDRINEFTVGNFVFNDKVVDIKIEVVEDELCSPDVVHISGIIESFRDIELPWYERKEIIFSVKEIMQMGASVRAGDGYLRILTDHAAYILLASRPLEIYTDIDGPILVTTALNESYFARAMNDLICKNSRNIES